MEVERNVKWLLAVSVIMLFFSQSYAFPIYYYSPSRQLSTWDNFWYLISRIDILAFVATVTTAALLIAGYGRKDLTYRSTIYLFLVSMGLLFIAFTRWIFGLPYPY